MLWGEGGSEDVFDGTRLRAQGVDGNGGLNRPILQGGRGGRWELQPARIVTPCLGRGQIQRQSFKNVINS